MGLCLGEGGDGYSIMLMWGKKNLTGNIMKKFRLQGV